MNRRDFSVRTAAQMAVLGGLGLTLSVPASAQGLPLEGKDFAKVSPPAPVAAAGKIEVVEFFWYGCPHCNELEPQLEAWVRKLPADVAFRRVPVGFSPMHEFHQKLFYALELGGQLEAMHRKVFATIHVERKRLDKDADVLAFAAAQGLDGNKLVETMKSFSVSGKSRQAKQLTTAYQIDGVPALGVQGRFNTSASKAGGVDRAFAVADFLIGQVRKSAG